MRNYPLGDAVAEIDNDTWIRRFKAQLALLQPDLDPGEAAAIANDCWVWDGWNAPEAAAWDYSDAMEGRYVG